MKYIRLKDRGFILFPETEGHREIAALFATEDVITVGVESAGFVHANDWCDGGQVVCSGQSMGLGLFSLPEDTELLRRQLSR